MKQLLENMKKSTDFLKMNFIPTLANLTQRIETSAYCYFLWTRFASFYMFRLP